MNELLPDNFPYRLKEIADPPEKLYREGTLPPEDHKWLAVVGSRKYTNYGREVCEKLIEGLAGYPVVIVSGLALGIDALAHRSALKAGLPCVAVPGSGLDKRVLYPATNRNLANDILSAGGALLSEFEPNFHATTWGFLKRNRIMAGLSDAVLVIEAETRSGSLVTSRFATEYNRDVFTIPGSIFSSSSSGPHMLLRLGATPITSPDDLISALGFEKAGEKKKQSALLYDSCSPEEKRVIDALHSPLERDELITILDLSVSEANTLLSLMELKGLIKESSGEFCLL
ncbi:MAG: DNA-protecting protein DprA [Candidatus Taylorbacteria bacterium CG11_big_fil_rev_8_21_14_0_20_46_11]|uniref:DNA-protecting protein DprA n=1 Tax=Candidatus Taylorbacteria bacterium CG11_big_fil_rev_8_21_14_0_20_46_11 TaxID=1975025 RepID=A0A2H0KCI0_9BACT|nr:MAG: DNA-protecting protein DprA [Candidatus Taylorbacteria bacterium CG11_big_fil_rev_8_21_14_0_20_46_11]